MAVRNNNGQLLVAAVSSFNFITDIEVAKAKAICESIHLALSKGLKPLCVESDSYNVVSLCSSVSHFKCDLGNIVQDVRDIVALNDVRSVYFIPRSSNLVAHGLAKWALLWKSPTIWAKNFPNWLVKLAEYDVLVSSSC
ncbi:hypothetical protein ACOSQ2_029062 [Xanthoceras sorbifolium]